MAAAISIMASTKMFYAEARPYFITSDIEPLGECTAGFGNPSGHSMFSVMWAFLLHLHIFEGFITSVFAHVSLYFITTPFAFLVAFSRLYVGVHSLNQIVYGSLLGFYLALYMHY
jgi:membrane-associated phospholipid phosphatase